MLWPNCSFGLVMWLWPCATAAKKTSGRAAARQGRRLRLSIEKPPGGTRAGEFRALGELIALLYASKGWIADFTAEGPMPARTLQGCKNPRPRIRDSHGVLEMRRS